MLPTPLLSAISADHGGKVVLILGAGCSKEAPTSLPLARECAQDAHRRLVADGVLRDGDCPNPEDLSILAETVFEKTGGQTALVERMGPMRFRQAQANRGYSIVAALLWEHAISAVLTLNFDLAIFNAIASLGAAANVAVILGPEDHHQLQLVNIVYVHRSAKAEPEKWILRANEIDTGWQEHWEQVVAQRFLANPVSVFVGLGSPARVLVETAKLIRSAIPEGTNIYQVDIVNRADSAFFAELNLPPEAFIRMGWTGFVEELATRLSLEHCNQLHAACKWLVENLGLHHENYPDLCTRIVGTGLLNFGSIRASWLLEEGPYLPWRSTERRLIADLLLAIGFVERNAQVRAYFDSDGIVEFRRGPTIVGRVVFASGKGFKSWFAIEAELKTLKRRWASRQPEPTTVIVGGVSGHITSPTPPSDITGDVPNKDILGSNALAAIAVEDLRNRATFTTELLDILTT
jgi:hypothetical protein